MSYIHQPTSYEIWFVALVSSASIGLTSLVPCALDTKILGNRSSSTTSNHQESGGRLKLLLSFAVGSILGDIFLHLIPESIDNERSQSSKNAHFTVGLSVIGGFLMFIVAEKFIENLLPHILAAVSAPSLTLEHVEDNDHYIDADKTEKPLPTDGNFVMNDANNNEISYTKSRRVGTDQNKTHSQRNNTKGTERKKTDTKNSSSIGPKQQDTAGYLNLIANGFDNFTHGLTVGASFLVGFKVGFVTTFVIIIHEIPHEICDYAILIRSGFSRWNAVRAQSATAIFGILGTVAALSAKSIKSLSSRTSWILPFSSGGFLYIALVNILPELLDKHTSSSESAKQVICVACGIIFMAIVAVL